jgi:hypothetical protein
MESKTCLIAMAAAFVLAVNCQGEITIQHYNNSSYWQPTYGNNTYRGLWQSGSGNGYAECDAWHDPAYSDTSVSGATPERGQHWYTSGTGSAWVRFEAWGSATSMLHYAFLNYAQSTVANGGEYCHANLTATAQDYPYNYDSGYQGDTEIWWGVSSSSGSLPSWWAYGWQGEDWFEDSGSGATDRCDVTATLSVGWNLYATGASPASGDLTSYHESDAFISYNYSGKAGYIDSEASTTSCGATMYKL